MDRVARHWIEHALARCLLAALGTGPRWWGEWLGRGLAGLLRLFVPRLWRVALRNLEMAMPELDATGRERIARGSFRSVGRILAAVARFPRIDSGNVADWIRYEGLEHFHQARAGGKGVLFATAHLGNWELSAFAHGLMTEPMHVVVRPLDNPRLDALARHHREMSGNRVIDKRGYARGILRALADNQAVGILVDQNTAADEGVFIDFFGIKACVGSGFAKLWARSGAAVIPGFALWSDRERTYVLRFHPPMWATGDTVADTQRVQGELERVIREFPDQWLWMHRRWKTRPPGEPGLYD
jgi:KDO2-lipid IV(A) lauroyltransferase